MGQDSPNILLLQWLVIGCRSSGKGDDIQPDDSTAEATTKGLTAKTCLPTAVPSVESLASPSLKGNQGGILQSTTNNNGFNVPRTPKSNK